MGEPLVSIVTPSLNQARYIERTLDSIRDQTYPNIEHIVVDGGSSDGTLELLSRRADAKLTWTSGPDRGMYDAINKGLREARGSILAYLNSDDFYPPWAVDRVVRLLNRRPDVGLVYGDYIRLDEVSGNTMLMLQAPFSRRYLKRIGFLPQPTVFWRRSLYERVGEFDSTLHFVGDCDYWIRASERVELGRLDEVLAYDRIQPGAKRSVEEGPLARELAGVRARYRDERDFVPAIVVRAIAAMGRRVRWVRLLKATRSAQKSQGPWSGFLGGYDVRVRPAQAALSFLPVVGVRFHANALRLRLR